MAVRNGVTVRGTSNGNERGSSEQRRQRKNWMLEIFAADKKLVRITWWDGRVEVDTLVLGAETLLRMFPESVISAVEVPTCRCYRCGKLLWFETLTVDRVIPGCKGGTYRRNNIRPACSGCNSETGAPLARGREHQSAKKAAARKRQAKKATGISKEIQEVLAS